MIDSQNNLLDYCVLHPQASSLLDIQYFEPIHQSSLGHFVRHVFLHL